MDTRKFITYFDYLGFKDFILNNDTDYQGKIMDNIFRDVENALAKGKLVQVAPGHVTADLSQAKLNCINFSDTVVYWSNDLSPESFEEIIKVTHIFNWRTNTYFFPARGCLTIGELERVEFDRKSEFGGSYNINSVFGKGLVKAHEIAESQEWAGTIIDPELVDYVDQIIPNCRTFIEELTKTYNVSFKEGLQEVRAFNLVSGELSDLAFENVSKNIRENFAKHNKSLNNPGVAGKIKNTIDFLSTYRNFKPTSSQPN